MMRPVRPIRLLKPATAAALPVSLRPAQFSLRHAVRLALAKRSHATLLHSGLGEDALIAARQETAAAPMAAQENADNAHDHGAKTHDASIELALPLSTVEASAPTVQRIARAFLQDNHTSLALRHLAAHIGDFCTTLSADNEGPWEADLELNPAILAATHLRIQLSRQALILRFACRDKTSHDLVWMGQLRLRDMLQPVLHAPCEIEIHVE